MASTSSLLKQAGYASAQEGLLAAAQGVTEDACPYDAASSDPAEQARARYWKRGHSRHVRRSASHTAPS